jgi:peroxiredoxin
MNTSKYLDNSKVFLALLLFFISFYTMKSQNTYRTATTAKGLQVGDTVNDFTATDLHGNIYQLSSALKNGPVVVIFYRGHWCPYCNQHLKNLQDSLSLIYEKGVSVVAISPEKSEFLKMTAEKTGAEFSLLYDEGYHLSDLFDLTFRPDSLTRVIYNTVLGADLKNAHSDESQQLPIPATFIINQNHTILWRHFDPDYKKRSTIPDIVKNLP